MSRSTNKRAIAAYKYPHSAEAEAFRKLRTNIELNSVQQPLQTLMVTSSEPGEGKSTVAANLAVTYALAGQRVALIDANLRKPVLHRTFAQLNGWGLVSVLNGQCALKDAIYDTEIDQLKLIPSGPVPHNPTDLILSNVMRSALAELKERFDLILFDSPPVLTFPDAQILSMHCDGVILVVRSGKLKQPAAAKAKRDLEHVNARIVGAVLNHFSNRSKGLIHL
ncbi:CpsD/CapB family tyrosine-protein kinase [Paenibacillus pinistramenti]|uniref:CpsD/CapB family tyrosine-protein kinase n=1 Tax=Paenibacillus pinistramenti TaxID=1768003 RepID=UPI001107D639|nr:CpsD/CapB family tyrosine-protein kinase [Paenibacillus pinistramenti]